MNDFASMAFFLAYTILLLYGHFQLREANKRCDRYRELCDRAIEVAEYWKQLAEKRMPVDE